MAEAIVILPPHVRCQQVGQRGDGPPPGNLARDLEPLGVLIEHGIHNVNEGLVAGEESIYRASLTVFVFKRSYYNSDHFAS